MTNAVSNCCSEIIGSIFFDELVYLSLDYTFCRVTQNTIIEQAYNLTLLFLLWNNVNVTNEIEANHEYFDAIATFLRT